MQGYPARIVHDGRGCPVCATTTPTLVVQAGPLPAPYPNPRAEFRDGGPNGTHWYHGTNFDPDSSEEPKRLRPEPRDYSDSSAYHKHWNTDFGVHFTSMPDVARNFARNFAGPDREAPTHARIAHADLHMRNPQHFENEHEMVDHAIGVARKHGLHHDVFDRDGYDDIHEGHEDEVGLQQKDEWVNSHPHREQIVNHFENDLKSKGHDGITYGNSYEGPPGHHCAIAFRSTPVNIHQWEHLHPQHPGHLGRRVTAAQVYYHGSAEPGLTHILPAAHVNREVHYPGLSDKNYAYATTNLEDAWTHAQNAHVIPDDAPKKHWENPGRPRVYEVHAIGGDHHVEKDPDLDPVTNDYRDTEPDDYRSPKGFKVVRELEPPDEVRSNYIVKNKNHWIDNHYENRNPEDFGVHRQRATASKADGFVRGMPTRRLFGPTHGLDHRLFDGEKLRPQVRAYILETLNGFWKPRYGLSWDQWARVYFAGSEASEWTSETLEGNNDFDILIGVDYDAYRANGSRKDARKTNEEITDELNEGFRKGLNPRTTNATIMVDGELTGPWDNTWYVNKDSYDIREIRPYAAYDVTADKWVVKPPHLPEWSTNAFPEGKGLAREIRGIIDMAKGILAMPEPYRTQNGRALWEFVHANRSDAFGAQGEGWWDARNVIEKALDQAGLMQQLWVLMDKARQDPHVLDSPAGWSNDPGR